MEVVTTLRVVVMLAVVEALVRSMKLSLLARLLGVRINLTPSKPGAERLRMSELPPRARRQIRCTQRVADVWPLSKGPCLRRALVSGHLLRARNPAIRLGVAASGDEMYAHAWLEIDDRPLENIARYGQFEHSSGEPAE